MMHICKRKIKECCAFSHHAVGDVVLTVKNLRFAYPESGRTVLEDIDLEIKRHANVAIIGPNGGGKTTFLKLVLGILKPTGGEISVLGTPPHRSCRHIGYVPQHKTLRPDFPITVNEVVLQGCAGTHFLGWHPGECRQCVNSVMEEMEIGALANRPFCKLSGGERQRVLIARALSGHPDLLLLDEPLANVDPASRSKFREILKSLSHRMTVMTVSHDLGDLSESVDLVVFVNRTATTYQPEEIRSANVRSLYREGTLKENA